jgi:hypothetical protein
MAADQWRFSTTCQISRRLPAERVKFKDDYSFSTAIRLRPLAKPCGNRFLMTQKTQKTAIP